MWSPDGPHAVDSLVFLNSFSYSAFPNFHFISFMLSSSFICLMNSSASSLQSCRFSVYFFGFIFPFNISSTVFLFSASLPSASLRLPLAVIPFRDRTSIFAFCSNMCSYISSESLVCSHIPFLLSSSPYILHPGFFFVGIISDVIPSLLYPLIVIPIFLYIPLFFSASASTLVACFFVTFHFFARFSASSSSIMSLYCLSSF